MYWSRHAMPQHQPRLLVVFICTMRLLFCLTTSHFPHSVSLAFFGILYYEYSYCWCWRCCWCLLEKLIPNEVRQESPYLVWRWINRYKLRCEWKRFGMWYKTVFATFLRVLFAFDAHTQSLANSITCKTMNIHDFWSSILNLEHVRWNTVTPLFFRCRNKSELNH